VPVAVRPFVLILALCLLQLTVGCGAPTDDDDSTESVPPCENDSVPELLLQEIEDDQPVGFEVQVVVQVSDPEGISTVSLYYRTEGAAGFAFTFMNNEDTGAEDLFVGTIPASVVQDPAVDYYVRATDRVVPCTGEAFEPAAAPEEWHSFTTRLDLSGLPFYAEFEFDGISCLDGDLEDLGWAVAYQSFPQGIHNWRPDDRNPLTGDCSVSHSEGIPGGFWECPPPDGEGNIVRQNWLISPPLDFSGKDQVAVRWFERHVESGICAESHGLYVSTTFPDPEVGEYQLISEVPIPGNAWQSSDWYDLSAYAGQEKVYVALYYDGGSAGRWQVDDFYVGEPLADLALDSADPLPAGTVPGSSGLSLNVTLSNTSASYSAPELQATLTTADPDLSVVSASATFAAMAPGETAVGSVPFTFDISSSQADNSYLDFAVQLEDGVGHYWTVPVRLLLGQESTATITYTATEDLALELGHGPPVAPNYSVAVDTAELGGLAWQVNVTEQADLLPPGPGVRRWFLRATNSGLFPATLDSFELTVGGIAYAAVGLPAQVDGEAQLLTLLPDPPALSVDSFTTDPSPAVPGQELVLDSFTLRNDGADTAGSVTCVLGSSDPDVSAISTTPVAFGSSPISSGATAGSTGTFSMDIAATHIDNSSVELTLLCSDGADTLPVSFTVEVPYAFPVVESVRVDDDTGSGDDDGLAEPGEIVDVYITARNDGAFATSGPLTATVAVSPTSTAPFTLSSSEPLQFGSVALASGASIESSNAVQVAVDPSALMGDAMILDLTWTSGSDTWTEELLLDVTNLPWLACPETDDQQGDVLGSGEFDIRACSYRSDGVMLEVEVESWVPYTASTLFLDVFFYEVPGLYSVETVGGVADFEDGCVFGDDLQESVPIAVDLTQSPFATVRVALVDMNILGNNTQVAFRAGSCPDDYFCDSYPLGALSFNIEQGTYNCDGSDFIPINW